MYTGNSGECLATPSKFSSPSLLYTYFEMASVEVNKRWFDSEAHSEFGALRATIDAKKEQGWDEAWSVHFPKIPLLTVERLG